MPIIVPETLLSSLLWIVAALAAWMVLLILTGAWLQIRRDRMNRFRIACHRRWEDGIVAYLFHPEHDAAAFEGVNEKESRLLIPFLVRVMDVIAGSEGRAVRDLYAGMHLEQGLGGRLDSRFAKARGLAALEVGHFRVEAHYPMLVKLLDDPVPHVAHAAARSLASTQDLRFAEPVLQWLITQEIFQRDRLLWILEAFGPELLPWMEKRMDADTEPDPLMEELYASLAGSFRNHAALARVLNLLQSTVLEVQAAALKALGALGDPAALPEALPFVTHESWILRAQAAKILGILGGYSAIPHLTELMTDPVFDVRRNAAYSLSQLGNAGITVLEWLSGFEGGDPFARDLAAERLQWSKVRGR